MITSAGGEPRRLSVAGSATVRGAAWQLVRADRRAIVIVFVLNCSAALAGLAGPWLVGKLMDLVAAKPGSAAVDLVAAAIVGFAALQLVLARFARYAAHRFAERALCGLRDGFVDRVLALPTSTVERAGTGDLMTRSSVDMASVGAAVRAAPDVLLSLLQALLIFAAVFLLAPELGICAVVGVPIVWLAARWYLRRARDAYLAEGDANSVMIESLTATAGGARTVDAFRLAARRVAEGDRLIRSAYAARRRTLFLRSVLFPVTSFAHMLPVSVMLVRGGWLYVEGAVSLGDVIAASLYMWQLVDPLNRVLNGLEQLQSSGASLARIKGVGEVEPERAPVVAVPSSDRIDVSGVHFAYSDNHDVLAGIDFHVRPGEKLAVVGPSGAGKSTLGRLLAGVEIPRTGTVTVGGVPVADLSPDERRRRVVLVTQEHHVFLGTLRHNLAISSASADDDAMLAALAAVGAEWVRTMPDGLNSELGPGHTILDSSQAQQVALARVVLADPHTLVLDEATASLDPTTARHTERSLAAVLRGRTVIAVAHRLHTAHDADRIIILDRGRVTEQGSHNDLIGKNGTYASLWRNWTRQ
jgi:ABC-type multidrug transport system fused ATPase/permease subunit